MKTLFLLGLVAIMATSCKKETDGLQPAALAAASAEDGNSYFAFGKSLIKCSGDCAEFYQLMGGQLYPDNISSYIPQASTLSFSKAAMSNNQYMLAKPVQDNFPAYLLARPNQSFGCPNCHDQGLYHVEWVDNGVTKYWDIDTDLNALPAEIRPWVQQMENVLNQLP